LRYTPSGAAVCSFGLATNRVYVASDGTKKEEAEFIRIVSWNKLAELCSQLLSKGRKVYVEGRLQTRSWETPDGITKQTTEVVIDDMRILDSKRSFEEASSGGNIPDIEEIPVSQTKVKEEEESKETKITKTKGAKGTEEIKEPKDSKGSNGEGDKIDLDDLPF